ncbi:hypothetical protein BD626DRAFT_518844 [Schizophyllum amplum]|uniref:F-box domain-containing protein n=1 Tax=Schizophyllum amplum TaxID=97359 RepID=A0A550BVM0_9AGAR|nr:hypothetical protein BD626DRAFT_518844 [Auriculariopsis ampla]
MRRSSRIAAASGGNCEGSDATHSSHATSDVQFFELPPPTRKRSRRATDSAQAPNTKRRKYAKPVYINGIPLELLIEIFSYLHPHSLLNVSWSTKAFRNILMSRSMATIWKNSLASVHGLPPVPDDMNEPQYVELVWGKACHYCGSTKAVTWFWATRIRYCKKCLDTRSIFTEYHHMLDYAGELRRVVPRVSAIEEIIPPVHAKEFRYRRWNTIDLYPVNLVKRYAAELQELGISDGKPEAAAEQWVHEKRERLISVKKHAELCEGWVQRQEAERKAEIERKRNRREQAVIQRLTDLGWGEEISLLPREAIGQQPSVRLAQPLTLTAWAYMEDRLVSFLSTHREQRLSKQRTLAIRSRHDLLAQVYPVFRRTKPFRAILPSAGDLAKLEAVQRVILDVPFDQELPERALLDVLCSLPQTAFDDWHAQAEQKVLELVTERLKISESTKDALGTFTPTLDTLKLATAIFSDGFSSHNLTYPAVLVWPKFSGNTTAQISRGAFLTCASATPATLWHDAW